MIDVRQLVVKTDEQRIVDGVSCTFGKERMIGIIGPNGAGKSTLLGAISGYLPYHTGEVLLDGKRIESYSRKALAKRVAVLQQGGLPGTMFTVREVVEMARYPFQNWLGDETGDAGQVIGHALQVMGLEQLAERRLDQLSGGERQRVALAKVLAQQPEIIMLDEPTTYLDIGYQVQLLDVVRDWQRLEGMTVIAVLHDLNLAAQYCDSLIVMNKGRIIRSGSPDEVLTAEMIREVYGAEAVITPHPVTGCPQLLLQPGRSAQQATGDKQRDFEPRSKMALCKEEKDERIRIAGK
ncbi:heme ABC transporter ATP-binding protein [Paenibacillus tarimensis]